MERGRVHLARRFLAVIAVSILDATTRADTHDLRLQSFVRRDYISLSAYLRPYRAGGRRVLEAIVY